MVLSVKDLIFKYIVIAHHQQVGSAIRAMAKEGWLGGTLGLAVRSEESLFMYADYNDRVTLTVVVCAFVDLIYSFSTRVDYFVDLIYSFNTRVDYLVFIYSIFRRIRRTFVLLTFKCIKKLSCV